MSQTPMMQQYQEAKDRHPGMLLLFRMGDFFELFGEDAKEAARVLGLTLTSRDKTVPMAGFPHQALDSHLQKLLQHGHRVAICDQVEDAALARGLVKREVTRIVSPGTLTEEELLDPGRANHLAACCAQGSTIGLAWVDLSTCDFQAADIPEARLADELNRLCPAECLCAEGERAGLPSIQAAAFAERLRGLLPAATLSLRPDWTFEPRTARSALFEHFGVTTMAGFGFADNQAGLTAAGALLLYLGEMLKTSLPHLHRLRPYHLDEHLFLDDVTRRSLELTRTLREGERHGSLLWAMDRTVTPMGARLLVDWLLSPLADIERIERRLDAVAELKDDHGLRQALTEELRRAYDLQRLTARASTGRASPRDLGAIGKTLELLPRIQELVQGRQAQMLRTLSSALSPCPELCTDLNEALVDGPPLTARDGGIFKRGYSAELDALYEVARGGKEWLARFQAQECLRTGIANLKVGFNKVFGYYIEVTRGQSSKVPADYERRQTVKNAERYVTAELKEHEEQVLTAEEKSRQTEYDLFVSLRDRVAAEAKRLSESADGLAQLDVLTGLATLADSRGYVRPLLTDTPILEYSDGRHPVLDQVLAAGTLVPNDASLGTEAGMILLITGPNMAGKSVYIRQVALLTLMAQMGSFVPARRARVGLVDRIFTRVGASDELSRSQSTFMVEMTEAANILNNATRRSLVILDEIGRGTSTYDGVSLAWAITEYLHDEIGCRSLFATHYHELAQLAERLKGLNNLNALVDDSGGNVVFLHRIAPGSADQSYGIHVARLAGVPDAVIKRAWTVLSELEAHHLEGRDGPTIRRRRRRTRTPQPTLFHDSDSPVTATDQ
jgi:DNA mismatch repair protein MutS